MVPSIFCSIGLVKVLWNKVTGIMNPRITSDIYFHGTLPVFRSDRGVGTASLKSKLLHKLMAIIEEIIYKTFLGLNKMYDALD